MSDLFARPLGPDGEPTGPIWRLGSNIEVRVDPGARDQWAQVEKAVTRPNPYFHRGGPIRTALPIELTFPKRTLSLGAWVLWFTNASDAPPPVSRGTAWRDGAYAACVHLLTGPPVIDDRGVWPAKPCYPRWYIDLLVMNIRRAYAEHPELFDARSWLTNAPEVNMKTRQLAEQRPDALRLYDRNWNIATEPGAGVHSRPRTVARDYPPPAEPCKGRVVADPPPIENVLWSTDELSNRP
ncbi:hypothetical protein TPB0596_12230 [Tsukamurella pulmonis]|uniref:hypothetical protein n=1 Tax=Tsukamurella pulmonis TaxID=47312 RepID=UPI001EDFBAE7|nr:hypothetical protein [Tsukamurella pulmonis]BDD81460.1 hypothetical protein TPB0596_12230 [Tsukamurella pulmonis]